MAMDGNIQDVRIPFLYALLLFTAIWLICRLCIWIRHRTIEWRREVILLLMYFNLAVIIRFVFFPLERINGKIQPLIFSASNILPFKIILIPFVGMFDYLTKRNMLVNVIGNIAMFIPTGIILPIISRKLDRFGKVVAVGALISLCIEVLQLLFSERTTDINDLILNTIGTAVGFCIFLLIKKIIKREPAQK